MHCLDGYVFVTRMDTLALKQQSLHETAASNQCRLDQQCQQRIDALTHKPSTHAPLSVKRLLTFPSFHRNKNFHLIGVFRTR
jgi:hypothetical protein